MNYKAVIFDLDGTLVHTMPEYRYKIVGQTLDELRIKSCKEHIDQFWFGKNRDQIISDYFGLESDIFWEVYGRYDQIDLRKEFSEAYGDVDFIDELKQTGYKVGIVTGVPYPIMNLEVGMLGSHKFDAIVIAQISNGIKPKPDPQGLYVCLNQLNVKANEAIYIGNGAEDVEAAQNAGMFDVLLDRKEYSFPGLNPSLKIDSLYELRELLRR